MRDCVQCRRFHCASWSIGGACWGKVSRCLEHQKASAGWKPARARLLATVRLAQAAREVLPEGELQRAEDHLFGLARGVGTGPHRMLRADMNPEALFLMSAGSIRSNSYPVLIVQ